VAADEGVRPRAAARRRRRPAGPDYDVKTAAEQADDLATSFAEGLAFFNIFLLVFAGVALFVGTFIILNTFSMLVAQRTRELALLRALGASRARSPARCCWRPRCSGVVGSTVGLLGGLGIAAALRALFATFGPDARRQPGVRADTVAWSYAVGIVVTLLAAYFPARRAARTAPVAAMRDELVSPERSLRRRTLLGPGSARSSPWRGWCRQPQRRRQHAASLVGAGSLALILAAVALSPVLAQPFLRVVGSVLPRVWGRTGHLARENALRNPRRTAATASALMIGLALVSAFSILGASTNASVDKIITEALGADYVVSTAVQQPFTSEVATRLSEVEGVEQVMRQRFGMARSTAARRSSPPSTPRRSTPRCACVRRRLHGRPRRPGVLVDEATADARGWAVGDDVELLLPNGSSLDLTVGGVYEANQAVGPLVVPLADYEAAGGPALDQYVYVDVADDADDSAVREELTATVAAYPVVTLKDQGEFKDEQKAQVDQLLLLINALLVLSVLIAVLGSSTRWRCPWSSARGRSACSGRSACRVASCAGWSGWSR
jgi:putative ABC transport system permease protein